jgi:predicted dehydrogenase
LVRQGRPFFHAPLIAAAAGCELAGVVTRSAERRSDLERDHPGTAAYDDLAQRTRGLDGVLTSFARAVRGRGALPVDPWDAVAGLELLEAAQRSAAAGRVVALNPGGSAR